MMKSNQTKYNTSWLIMPLLLILLLSIVYNQCVLHSCDIFQVVYVPYVWNTCCCVATGWLSGARSVSGRLPVGTEWDDWHHIDITVDRPTRTKDRTVWTQLIEMSNATAMMGYDVRTGPTTIVCHDLRADPTPTLRAPLIQDDLHPRCCKLSGVSLLNQSYSVISFCDMWYLSFLTNRGLRYYTYCSGEMYVSEQTRYSTMYVTQYLNSLTHDKQYLFDLISDIEGYLSTWHFDLDIATSPSICLYHILRLIWPEVLYVCTPDYAVEYSCVYRLSNAKQPCRCPYSYDMVCYTKTDENLFYVLQRLYLENDSLTDRMEDT